MYNFAFKLWHYLHPGPWVSRAGLAGGDGLVLLCSVGAIVVFMHYMVLTRNGLVYGSGWDCSDSEDSKGGYVAAMKYFQEQGR